MPSVVFWVLVLENSFFGKMRHSVTFGFSDALLSEIYQKGVVCLFLGFGFAEETFSRLPIFFLCLFSTLVCWGAGSGDIFSSSLFFAFGLLVVRGD
jgi:hypothetical protein